MNENSNRNATATWSGFSHQGKVGLLVALRQLQETEVDKINTFIEFENREDVAIYNFEDGEKRYLSVHQVKAYYSNGSHRKSKYSSVLNNTFAEGEYKFLHTTTEITDWETSQTENTNGIDRFLYEEGKFHCETTEIDGYIINELKVLLEENSISSESALKRLVYALDCKIREEHKTKRSKSEYDIKFSLQEIENIVNDNSEFQMIEIYKCRKKFYTLFEESYKRTPLDGLSGENIKSIIGYIYSNLDDDTFRKFLERLNLSRDLSIYDGYSDYYGLRQVFYKVLLSVSKYPEFDESKSMVVYKDFQYALTTIIDEVEDAQEVARNIIINIENMRPLWEKTSFINKEIDGKLVDLYPSIMNIDDDDESRDNFMSYNKSTALISRENAINNLNNGENS